MKRFCVTLALLAAILPSRVASAGITLSDYNLITVGNLSDRSDVQGRVLVGGTLTSSLDFSGQLSGPFNPPAGIFNSLAAGVTLNDHGHGYITGAATAPYTAGLGSYLNSVSMGYAALATTGTVDTSDANQIKFNANPTMINGRNVAVFSLNSSFFTTAATANGTVTQLNGISASTTVVVNVLGGGTLNFGSNHLFQNFNNAANIIFNFENATSLTGVSNLGGAILAPLADLNTGQTLKGSIYVNSVSNVGEIDLPAFTGFVPNVTSVPEPGSLAMLAIGAPVLAGWFRRRR